MAERRPLAERRWRVLCHCALVWLAACQGERTPRPIEPTWLALELGGDGTLDATELQVEPGHAVGESRLGPGRTLYVQAKALPFRVKVAGFCAARVESLERQPSLTPLLSLPRVMAQVGFDVALTLHAKPGCEEARLGRVRFEQVQGPPETLTPSADGFGVTLRTPSAPPALSAEGPHGLVPVSASEQLRLGFVAHYDGASGEAFSRDVTVTAAARATGLPTVAVGQRHLLRGAGWRVTQRPPRSVAEPSRAEGSALTSFAPDRSGRYALRDDDGCELSLHAGAHAEVPLDCGRAPCHADSSAGADRSPMAHALDALDVSAFGAREGCVPDCHLAGQAGIDDGGFSATAEDLAFRPTRARSQAELPVALARLSGVGCTGCHGPAAIPPEEGRAHIVSADVCASCHALPAPLDVVARWSAGAMARADATPESRTGTCATCHTTLGFLDRIGVRPQPRPASDMGRTARPEATAEPRVERADGHTGIACAACHAVHATRAAPGAHLLRAVAGAGEAPTRDAAIHALCGSCHAPLPNEARPSASAASLVSGRLPPALGSIEAEAPHAALPGACTACHGQLPATGPESGREAREHAGLRPTLDHAFSVREARCSDCHDASMAERAAEAQRDLTSRAEALSTRLREHCDATMDLPHRQATEPLRCDTASARRAGDLLNLLMRDGAAATHNLPFARQLLDEAEGTFAAP